MTERRCEEHVWDNGDTTECGKALPCPDHLAEKVMAKRQLERIRSLLDTRYAPDETYEIRLRNVILIALGEKT